MSSEDDLSSALGGLPAADLPASAAERIRSRAHVVLGRERRLAERPALRRASRVYAGTIEPVLVAGACAIYLYWAFSATFALLN